MTTAIAGARFGSLSPERQALLRRAMLSVYYQSVGSQLESRGAPVMAVPPEIQPMPLDVALKMLETNGQLLWDVYWRIVRLVPVEGWKPRSLDRRYPQALVDHLGFDKVKLADKLRKHARLRAHSSLPRFWRAPKVEDEAIALASMLEDSNGIWLERDDPKDLSLTVGERNVVNELRRATQAVLGKTALDYITSLARSPGAQQRTRQELFSLQADVGLGLGEFIEDFYDTVAFHRFKTRHRGPDTVLISSCIVRQDTNTLTTTATVTTLAQANLEQLFEVIDPLAWHKKQRCDPGDLLRRRSMGPADDKSGPGPAPFTATGPSVVRERQRSDLGSMKRPQWRIHQRPEHSTKFTKHPQRGIIFRSSSAAASTAASSGTLGPGIRIDGGFIQARPVLIGSAAQAMLLSEGFAIFLTGDQSCSLASASHELPHLLVLIA